MHLADAGIGEHFWTDSRVVLGYINNEARRFHVYVANRVQAIRNHTEPAQWHYVPSKENPADHASRGLSPSQLLESNWLKGPQFLLQKTIQYSTENHQPEQDDPEVKGHSLATAGVEDFLNRFERFSTWSGVVRAVGNLQENIRTKIKRDATKCCATEVNTRAETSVTKMMQKDSYSDELRRLQKGLLLEKSSSLLKLDPFLDEQFKVSSE